MLTDEPTLPLVGVSVTAGVTVKVVAEVAEFDEASVTLTEYAPAALAGTVKVTPTLPLAVEVPPEVIVAGVPPRVTVSAELAAKPEPEIVADEPMLPLPGLGAPSEGATVNWVADVAVCDEASVTVTG